MQRDPVLSSRSVRIAALAIFAVAVSVTALFANLKRLALDYDSIDYPFYAQFAAKFFDGQLPKSFSAQPDGYDFLGYHGTEGVYSFNQSLHLEPVKYAYALAFQLGKSPLPVYILIAMLYFLPVLYLVWIHTGGQWSIAWVKKLLPRRALSAPREPSEVPRDLEFILIFALLYTLYPAVLVTVNYDLRPRILLGAFFVLAVLAVLYRRPFPEKALLFGLLFLTREEALVFGAVVIGMNFFGAPNWRRAFLESGVLGAVWLVYLGALYFYFDWAGYPLEAPSRLSLLSPYLFVPLGLIGLTALIGLLLWWRKRLELRRLLQLLVFTCLSVPLAVELRTEVGKWALTGGSLLVIGAQRFVYSEKLSLFFISALLFVVIVRQLVKDPEKRKLFNRVLGALVVLCCLASTLRNATDLQAYVRQDASAAIVFQAVQETDPYSTYVLTDDNTYQAFYNYRNVTLYTRLPWSLAQANRFFPQNTPYLLKLLPQMEYVVISHGSEKDVLALLASANIHYDLLAQNEVYRVFRVIQ